VARDAESAFTSIGGKRRLPSVFPSPLVMPTDPPEALTPNLTALPPSDHPSEVPALMQAPLPPGMALPPRARNALQVRLLGTDAAPSIEAPISPQAITIVDSGTHGATLPRIANLTKGCSDGLLLLSATACLVARDTETSDTTPPAKRARIDFA